MNLRMLVALFCALSISLIAAAGEVVTKGKVDAVTVYRGQALVTRAVELKGPAGLQELVVTDLPARVIAGSIYAEGDEGVEIRSVLYRERPVGQDIREEVRKLDDLIRVNQDKQTANRRNAEVLTERKAYLGKLEQFTAPTATFELTKGVLNADTLQKITNYQFEQRATIAAEELKLATEERDLTEQAQVLQRQRMELTGGSARTVREALVFLNAAKAEGKLRLRYLVDSAAWAPSYNIRADAKREKVLVEYNATVQQMSGEDWTDVQMTLSTATPSLIARGPVISPLTVVLSPLATTKLLVQTVDEYGVQREQIVERRNKAQQERGQAVGNNDIQISNAGDNNRQMQQMAQSNVNALTGNTFANNTTGNWNQSPKQVDLADNDLNGIAGELQLLDLTSKAKIAKKAEKGKPISGPGSDESVSVTYDLPGRLSLPSRVSEQLIQIAALPMKGVFYKVAIPLLTTYVYEEALLTNDGKVVLLAGPASAFVAQQFVGKGEVPTVAIGEGFTIGFGIDASLRAERELLEKTETIQGGNRTLSFTYRIEVANFGTDPATVRILDRLPTNPSGKENDVRVTLMPTAVELSKDPLYEKNEHKKGILRWDSAVPAQAIGSKAFSLQYQFQLEYDKQMNIASVPPPPPPNPNMPAPSAPFNRELKK